jgi:hypothetical protein
MTNLRVSGYVNGSQGGLVRKHITTRQSRGVAALR